MKNEHKAIVIIAVIIISGGFVGIMIGLNVPNPQEENIVFTKEYYGNLTPEILNEMLDIPSVNMSIGDHYILRWNRIDIVISINDSSAGFQLITLNYTAKMMMFKVIELNPIIIFNILSTKELHIIEMLSLQLLKL